MTEQDEEDAIIAFLDALNDGSFDRTIPSRVPSGLDPGGRIQWIASRENNRRIEAR
jgi:cytochrome c peroxidase